MSDVKWTPGPWRKFNIRLENRKIHQLIGPFTIKNKVGEADCHLIAAAPELYEALADAIDDLEQVFKMCHGYVDTNDLARYRNALAKARGESK